jgi:hypothetical protein
LIGHADQRFAARITPQAKEWHRKRNLNLTEAERHMAARNWPDAEQHLVLTLAERRHTSGKRLDLLLQLVNALKSGRVGAARELLTQAIGALTQALEILAEVEKQAEAAQRRERASEIN